MRCYITHYFRVFLTLLILLAVPEYGWGKSLVCREPAIQGMVDRIRRIHTLLGENTTNIYDIRLFVTKEKDDLYIQSNFLSRDPERPGHYSDNPTKILVDAGEIPDIATAMQNIIFWASSAKDLPPDAENQLRVALKRAKVYVDQTALGDDGRPPLDLSEASNIVLARDNASVTSGEIHFLPMDEPPPVLTERLNGCCLDGLPPGRGEAIVRRLAKHSISIEQTRLLSLVIDSGTDNVINKSPFLKRITVDMRGGRGDWSVRLEEIMAKSRGKTLLILSHVANGSVVIEDAGGKAVFSMSLADLQNSAHKNNVNMVLFGCETTKLFSKTSAQIGIAGKYNTAFAAKRIAAALESSKNAFEFLSSVSTEGLSVVVRSLDWTETTGTAEVFAQPMGFLDRARRVFRIWFFRSP